MPYVRYDGVSPIGIALVRRAGMNMNVRNYCQIAFLANIPKHPKVASIEPYYSGVQCVRIDIVVEFEVDDADGVIATGP